MTAPDIAKQIIASCAKQARRIAQGKEDEEDKLRLAYLSGLNQGVNFVTRGEGLVTSQLVEQGAKLAGEAFGYTLAPPGG